MGRESVGIRSRWWCSDWSRLETVPQVVEIVLTERLLKE